MTEATFLVKGSADQPYTVKFRWGEGRFIATCTCAAAVQGSHCKHRLGIVLQDKAIVAGLDVDAIAEVVQAAAGATDIHERLEALAAAERQAALAKDALAAARRRLSEALLGV